MAAPVALTLPGASEKRRYVERMFDDIAPRYDLLNRIMTAGIDTRWRRRAIEAAGIRAGDLVLDMACGTGDLARDALAKGARVVGVDFAAAMLSRARTRVPGCGLVRADGLHMPAPDASFDAALCGFALRNFSDQPGTLAECARVLKPGGALALLEVDVPRSRALKLAFDAHFHGVVPILGRLFSMGSAYSYLSSSLVYLPSDDELATMLHEAGFATSRKQPLSGGLAQLVVATRGSGHA